MKQYISMAPVESAMANAATVYGLYLYALCLTNPVSMGYNGYTIATNTELSYNPEKLNAWNRFTRCLSKFFNTPFGKFVAVELFLVALVLSVFTGALPAFLLMAGLTAVSFFSGAMQAGYESKNHGRGYWNGFSNYITHNWAQTVAISSALFIATLGISKLIQAIRNAGSKAALANAAESQAGTAVTDDGLDWGRVRPDGMTTEQHVRLHQEANNVKFEHSVFSSDAVDITNSAWANRANGTFRTNIKNGNTVYSVPFQNAGMTGGKSIIIAQQCNGLAIVIQKGTTNLLVTAFPIIIP